MYGMPSYGNQFFGGLTNWLIDEACFKQPQYQMSIYYKYAPDGYSLFALSYVDEFLYWYTYE